MPTVDCPSIESTAAARGIRMRIMPHAAGFVSVWNRRTVRGPFATYTRAVIDAWIVLNGRPKRVTSPTDHVDHELAARAAAKGFVGVRFRRTAPGAWFQLWEHDESTIGPFASRDEAVEEARAFLDDEPDQPETPTRSRPHARAHRPAP